MERKWFHPYFLLQNNTKDGYRPLSAFYDTELLYILNIYLIIIILYILNKMRGVNTVWDQQMFIIAVMPPEF